MNVLFEDAGQLRTGSVLADQGTSLHVETASGRRVKVKAGSVLLRFAAPSAAEALVEAQRLAADLDADFLWEATGEDEFGFEALAREYYGGTPSAPQAVALALLLQSSPMHFYKRGKGRYRKAPPDALQAALASVARKAREAEQSNAWMEELRAGRLPEPLRARLPMLLYQPERNALEWKAVAAAAAEARVSVPALLARAGGIPSTHDYHFNRLVAQMFPRGLAFSATPALAGAGDELPLAPVQAFSIDDASTTEIDDAFSVRALHDGQVEIGIHIACPALVIARGSAHDADARTRLSTVYMPGRKITMLPETAIAAFTLAEGRAVPALSLYLTLDAAGGIVRRDTRVERVPIAANLRLAGVPEACIESAPEASDPAWVSELRTLWTLAQRLAQARNKPEVARVEYGFEVDWDAAGVNGEPGRVMIVPRARGSVVDRLVAELMIHVNATWGALLADAGAAGLYRVQSNGKVKLATRGGEHQGLGVTHYLWASSPLRRYADLVNQRQVLALARGEKPPYDERDPELHAILADFEATYAMYGEFQDRMERYWCLRWLLQEGVEETKAMVMRENLVRFDALPLTLRLADLPAVPPGSRVRVRVGAIDLLEETIECHYAGAVEETPAPA
jgi:exoribonuclease-2